MHNIWESCFYEKEVKKEINTNKEFGIRDSLAYATGDVGCNMSFALKSTMALFWTQAMGLGTLYSLLIIILQECDAINVSWLSDDTAVKIRSLVAILYLVAGVFQLVGLSLVYNLDKKTLAKMNEELKQRHENNKTVND